MERLSKTVSLQEPYLNPNARHWDSMSFTVWINATVQMQEARTALNVLCTTMIAQSPDVVSFLHILFYVRAANGMRNLVVNEQQYRIRGGSQAPTFKMARDLTTMDGGRLLLSTPVKRIVYGDGDPRLRKQYPVLVEGEDALSKTLVQFRAKHVIVTGAPPTTEGALNTRRHCRLKRITVPAYSSGQQCKGADRLREGILARLGVHGDHPRIDTPIRQRPKTTVEQLL